MMYLELVCKFEDTYAVRDSKNGYAYLSKEEIIKRIEEVPVEERNCLVNTVYKPDEHGIDYPVRTVKLKMGALPVFKDGINVVTMFDTRFGGIESVFDVSAYIIAHTATLLFDDKILAIIKTLGFVPTDLPKRMFKEAGAIGTDGERHISELPDYIKVLVIAHTILENDRLCIINITSCNLSARVTDVERRFLYYLSRFRMCYVYAEDVKAIEEACKGGEEPIRLFIDTQESEGTSDGD